MTPGAAASQFLTAVVLGIPLGLLFGILRPMKRRWLGDALFLMAVVPVWVYLCFAVCRGDPGPGDLAGLLLGGALWDRTVGRLLEAPILAVWDFFRGITKKFLEKVQKILKFYLHLGKNKVQ